MSFVFGDTPNTNLVFLDASGISDIKNPLLQQNNLSDVDNVSSARTNLGLAQSGIYIISTT